MTGLIYTLLGLAFLIVCTIIDEKINKK